jgi:hypothetical protein
MSSHDCSFLFNALDALSRDTSGHVRKYFWHAQMYISDMLRYIQVRWSGGTSERAISG